MLLKIENKKRKQNAFFLTAKGMDLAKELQDKYPNLEWKTVKYDSIQKCLSEY